MATFLFILITISVWLFITSLTKTEQPKTSKETQQKIVQNKKNRTYGTENNRNTKNVKSGSYTANNKVETSEKQKKFLLEKELQKTEQNIRLKKQHLLNYEIKYLYHMTHKDNLESILKNGLKSHNEIRKENVYVDISNNDVNNRRSKKEPIFNRCIHDYVPLYFNPKNPMLYVRKTIQDDIIILAINPILLYGDNTLFTNGNAASGTTSFYKDIYDLEKINWECINAEYWSDFQDGKRIRCSEVLTYPNIEMNHITKIFCSNSYTRDFVKHKIDNFANKEIKVEIEPNLYF